MTRPAILAAVVSACVGPHLPARPHAAAAPSAATFPASRPRHARILAIGNSFAANATALLPAMVEAADGLELTLAVAGIGGGSFRSHVGGIAAHEADPDDRRGRPYRDYRDRRKRVSLKTLLTAEPWDIVTVQQVSWNSYKPETYEPGAGKLIAYIRKHAPRARLVVHQTWQYHPKDKIFRDGFTPDVMFRGLQKAYADLAERYGAAVIPVGEAFNRVAGDSEWGYGAPKTEQTGPIRLHSDTHHASRAGSYLAGCVWFEFLFHRPPPEAVKSNRLPPARQAAFLRRTAHAVMRSRRAAGAASGAVRPAR